MGKTKNFSELINTDRVYAAMEEATAEPAAEPATSTPEAPHRTNKDRKTYTEEEARAAMMQFRTIGRKGVKLPRINLAFAPDVYEYIRTMSQVRGESMTEFVDHILRQSMEENAAIYAKALEFKKSL